MKCTSCCFSCWLLASCCADFRTDFSPLSLSLVKGNERSCGRWLGTRGPLKKVLLIRSLSMMDIQTPLAKHTRTSTFYAYEAHTSTALLLLLTGPIMGCCVL
uniref:Putative secreted protein n=1 Tax=Anopheles darlingi TaxID=43151 RepID=A0A2M4DIB5_ANODA